MTGQHKSGWLVTSSIAMELDSALTILGGYYNPPGYSFPESFVPLIESVSEEWRSEWDQYFTRESILVSLFSTLAMAAGLFAETDYSKLTLALRETTPCSLLKQLQDEQVLVEDDSHLAADKLVDVLANIEAQSYINLGLPARKNSHLAAFKRNIACAPRILKGGDLHARFWHWLDRFYYQSYEPWRRSRETLMHQQTQLALAALGAPSGSTPPEIGWLPPQNPVLRIPEVMGAIKEGHARVVFWVEPFGLADTWAFWQDMFITSFAELGELYENFQIYAADIAGKTKALADPTRLTILRIIRHFGMINTDIATFLGLARPTVSVHARILQEAGLIRSSKVGRETKHEIVPEEIHRLFADLKAFLDLPEVEDEKETAE